MIKNIIFDWAGVIKDSFEDQLFIVNKIFLRFGAKEISLEEFKKNWRQPYMFFYNKYLPNLTLEQEQTAYKEVILSAECPLAHPYPGIVDVIKDWKRAGFQMVAVSSDFSETLLPEMAAFGLSDIFLDVVTDLYNKQASIENLIKKHDFNKSETIIIGDSNHEIEIGRKIGVRTAAVTWGFTSEERLAASQPDFIAHNLDELKALRS